MEARKQVTIKHTIAPEFWRMISYIFFWFMCLFAVVCFSLFVRPRLKAGPDDGSTCGPFDRVSLFGYLFRNEFLTIDALFIYLLPWYNFRQHSDEGFGLTAGGGFDFPQQSHIEQLFGFSNICVYCDYSPSRELTAMIYPLFEYTLQFYLVLDFLQTLLLYQNGGLSKWFWNLSKIALLHCVLNSV